jgi:SNF2 family DNA or RNA helicase
MTDMNFRTRLLPYQQEAVDKLAGLKVGALYMEQGTGKTRTALEIVSRRLEEEKMQIVLWLCPCSVKGNLKNDIIKHCGEVPDEIVIKGIESISGSDRLYVRLAELVEQFSVMLIVDESNLVKNPKALRSQRIIELASKCKYRMILNGTPVSRNEADMYAQWYILDWRILGYKSFYSFARNHLEYFTIISPSGQEVKSDKIRRDLDKEY